MDRLGDGLGVVAKKFNDLFGPHREPWQVAAITASTVLTSVWLYDVLIHDESVYLRTKKYIFKLAKRVPAVRNRIELEVGKVRDDFQRDIIKGTADLPYFTQLPFDGLSAEEILLKVDKHLELGSYKWKDGRVSGAVYNFDPKVIALVSEVYSKASYTNPLHPDIFPGICKMEAEVVRMTATLFHGNHKSCGTMTTGGTESIIMACKAYRDYAREVKGITRPNIVMPKTAHSGFDKAAQYLGIHVRTVDVDPETTTVNMKSMEKAINRNTIMLVGSAPNYPYGTIDNIEAIGALGVKNNIPVHVDACLGGFVIVFMKRAGYKLPPFDFRVNGVTSISADPHKYGFAPKGSSLILYSDIKFLNHQFTVTTDWPGGVYGSPTVNGSRAGGIIAACWATLMSYGEDGYIETTKEIIDTARYIENGLRKMKGMFVFGTPATTVVALGSKVFDIYRLSAALSKRGWNLNALQFPPGIHICVTYMHTKNGVADQFLKDVKEDLEEIMKNPGAPVEGKMAIYGVAQSVSDRTLVGDFTRCFLNSMYYIPANGLKN